MVGAIRALFIFSASEFSTRVKLPAHRAGLLMGFGIFFSARMELPRWKKEASDPL